MTHTHTARRQSTTRTRRIAATVAAVPAIMAGLAVPANAAELTPVAQYVDHTVAGLESEVGGAVDALGLAAH